MQTSSVHTYPLFIFCTLSVPILLSADLLHRVSSRLMVVEVLHFFSTVLPLPCKLPCFGQLCRPRGAVPLGHSRLTIDTLDQRKSES